MYAHNVCRWNAGPRRGSSQARRDGAALVEMVLVLPLLLLVVFGVVEYAFTFHVLQTMTNAARDGARTLAVRSGTVEQARAVALNELADIHATFTVVATQPPSGSTNRDVTVSITVPRSQISLGISLLPPPLSSTLKAQVTMRKEGD